MEQNSVQSSIWLPSWLIYRGGHWNPHGREANEVMLLRSLNSLERKAVPIENIVALPPFV